MPSSGPASGTAHAWRWLLAALLLIGAAVATLRAAILRWSPCRGDYRAELCDLRQNDQFDIVSTSEVWQTLPGTFALLATAALAAALAWIVLLPATSRTGLPWGVRLLPALGPLVIGGAALATALRGWPGTHLAVWPGFVSEVAAVVVLVASARRAQRPDLRLVLALFAVTVFGAVHQALEWWVFGNLYLSYDTSPWDGLGTTLVLAGAGGAILVVTTLGPLVSRATRPDRTTSPVLTP